MPPRFIDNIWIEQLQTRRHLEAVKYIEENVDLIDTNLQKFMDDCPNECWIEVYEMFLKAGIDMKEYMNSSLKKWDVYIHETNPQYQTYYTIDYDKEMESLTWRTDWKLDPSVLDTLSGVVE